MYVHMSARISVLCCIWIVIGVGEGSLASYGDGVWEGVHTEYDSFFFFLLRYVFLFERLS